MATSWLTSRLSTLLGRGIAPSCPTESMRLSNTTIPTELPVWRLSASASSAFSLAVQHSLPFLLMLLTVSILLLVVVLLWLWIRRRRTQRLLEEAGFPTVLWTPKFWEYNAHAHHIQGSASPDHAKLASSSITRMLPRMARLQGPFGMYGTVYGWTTAVVHVAHPLPAVAILCGNNSNDMFTSSSHSGNSTRRRSSHVPPDQKPGARKAPAYNHFKNFCGNGVFTADGNDWKLKRSAVLHALMRPLPPTPVLSKANSNHRHNHYHHHQQQQHQEHKGNATTMEEQIQEHARWAGDRIVASIQAERMHTNNDDCQDDERAINVVPLIQRATIGLIYRYITHHDIPTDGATAATKHSSRNVMEEVKNQNGSPSSLLPLLADYLQSVTTIRLIILAQSRSIWFVLPRWCYQWLSGLYRQEETTLGSIRQFAAMACRHATASSPLGVLQRAYSNGDGEIGSKYHEKGSDGNGKQSIPDIKTDNNRISKDLLDEAITLLFAGQDTSAATVSWTLHLLSLDPKRQQRLAEEVNRVIAQHRQEENYHNDNEEDFPVFTKSMLSQMKYVDAVVKESMRLYPVAPFVVRHLVHPVTVSGEDGTLPSSQQPAAQQRTVTLPQGSMACIWIYGLQRHPQFWRSPDEFIPERWLVTNASERDAGITNGAYMPFAAGPRNCVGQPLAHIIVRTLVARIVHRYQIRDPAVPESAWEAPQGGAKTQAKFSAHHLRKDMQAGFTVLPSGGVLVTMQGRQWQSKKLQKQ